MTNILFFGSTTDSVLVLEQLKKLKGWSIAAVVTQPPKPVGRDKIITPTPVEVWAKQHDITTLSFPSNPQKPWRYANDQQVIDTLQPIGADLFISASYGIKIPWESIQNTRYGGINIHPSILPRWRGADPVPWAILSGDHQIGVSVVTLSESFDEGTILAQKKIPILPTDTSGPLRTKLFEIGADLLINILPSYTRTGAKPVHPTGGHEAAPLPYARKLTREDGFEPWETLTAAIHEGRDAERIERKYRALHPWPGVWTLFSEKRLKILALHRNNGILALDEVQLEGKKPVRWEQFQKAYLSP